MEKVELDWGLWIRYQGFQATFSWGRRHCGNLERCPTMWHDSSKHRLRSAKGGGGARLGEMIRSKLERMNRNGDFWSQVRAMDERSRADLDTSMTSIAVQNQD